MIPSGAVTKRVDRLERAGLVARGRSTDDARSRPVSLTPAGVVLVDRLVEQHVANEARLLGGLDAEERRQLAALLERLGRSLED